MRLSLVAYGCLQSKPNVSASTQSTRSSICAAAHQAIVRRGAAHIASACSLNPDFQIPTSHKTLVVIRPVGYSMHSSFGILVGRSALNLCGPYCILLETNRLCIRGRGIYAKRLIFNSFCSLCERPTSLKISGAGKVATGDVDSADIFISKYWINSARIFEAKSGKWLYQTVSSFY